MSQSDEIGYIEYLQNLNMVVMEIVADSLDLKSKQPEKSEKLIELKVKKAIISEKPRTFL